MKWIVGLLILIVCESKAQLRSVDVVDLAMSDAFVINNDSIIQKNNPASFSCQPSYIALGVLNRYFLSDLTVFNCAGNFQTGEFKSFYTSISRSGNNTFNELSLEAGYSGKISKKINVGILIQHYRWTISNDNYENLSSFIPIAGVTVKPFNNFSIGFILENPVRSKMTGKLSKTEQLPAILRIGSCLTINKFFSVHAAFLQHSSRPAEFCIAIKYRILQNGNCYVGYNPTTSSQSIGFTIKKNKMIIDIGLKTHNSIGNSGALSINYLLK